MEGQSLGLLAQRGRMQRIDLVIAAVVAVSVIGSAVGVYTYEEQGPSNLQYNVTWTTETEKFTAPAVTHVGQGSSEVSLPINRYNQTEVRFTVTVQGNGPRVANVPVEVEVRVPNLASQPPKSQGQLAQGQGSTSIQVTGTVPLNSTPGARTISAQNQTAAEAEVDDESRSDVGYGAWTIVVTFGSSGPGPLGTETHTISVAADVTTYRAQVSLATPDAGG